MRASSTSLPCGCPSRSVHLAGRLLPLFRDNDLVNVGAGLREARAAAMLAHQRRKSLRIIAGMQWLHLDHIPDSMPETVGGTVHGATVYGRYRHDEVMQARRFAPTIFFVGAIQVGSRGEVNLFGIPEGNGWAVRGPGAVGTQSMTAWADRWVVVARHLRPTLLAAGRPALTTVPGWETGHGPLRLVTPDAEFDFQGVDGQVRLVGVTPPTTPADIGRQFPHVDLAEAVGEVEEPSADDRRLLLQLLEKSG